MVKTLGVLLLLLAFEAGCAADRWWHKRLEQPNDPPAIEGELLEITPPYGSEDSGIFPPEREVCTSFDSICWMKTHELG